MNVVTRASRRAVLSTFEPLRMSSSFPNIQQGRCLPVALNSRRDFGTEPASYQGRFGPRIRWLRRISLSSTIVAASVMPLLTYFEVIPPERISMVGQIAIFSTAAFTSLSSTIFLQVVTHPYVHSMEPVVDDSGKDAFIANRIDMLGRLVPSAFDYSKAEPVSGSQHPFANHKIDDRYYYIEEGPGAGAAGDEFDLTIGKGEERGHGKSSRRKIPASD